MRIQDTNIPGEFNPKDIAKSLSVSLSTYYTVCPSKGRLLDIDSDLKLWLSLSPFPERVLLDFLTCIPDDVFRAHLRSVGGLKKFVNLAEFFASHPGLTVTDFSNVELPDALTGRANRKRAQEDESVFNHFKLAHGIQLLTLVGEKTVLIRVSSAGSLRDPPRMLGLSHLIEHLVLSSWPDRHELGIDARNYYDFVEFKCFGSPESCIKGFVSAVKAVRDLPWERVEAEVAVIDLEKKWNVQNKKKFIIEELLRLPDRHGDAQTLGNVTKIKILNFMQKFYGKIVLVVAEPEAQWNTVQLIEKAFADYPYFSAGFASEVSSKLSLRKYAGKTIQSKKNKTPLVKILMDNPQLKSARLLLSTLMDVDIHPDSVDVRCPPTAPFVEDCLGYIQRAVGSLQDAYIWHTRVSQIRTFKIDVGQPRFMSKLADIGASGALLDQAWLESSVVDKLITAVQVQNVVFFTYLFDEDSSNQLRVVQTDLAQPLVSLSPSPPSPASFLVDVDGESWVRFSMVTAKIRVLAARLLFMNESEKVLVQNAIEAEVGNLVTSISVEAPGFVLTTSQPENVEKIVMKLAEIASRPMESRSINLRDYLQRIRVRVHIPMLSTPEENVAVIGAVKKLVNERSWPRTTETPSRAKFIFQRTPGSESDELSFTLLLRPLVAQQSLNQEMHVMSLLFEALMEEHILSFAREPWQRWSAGKVVSYIVRSRIEISSGHADFGLINYVFTIFTKEQTDVLVQKAEQLLLRRFPQLIDSLTVPKFNKAKERLMRIFSTRLPSPRMEFNMAYPGLFVERGKEILSQITFSQFRSFAMSCFHLGRPQV